MCSRRFASDKAKRSTSFSMETWFSSGRTSRRLTPALQIDPASVEVDHVANVSHALSDGCEAFVESKQEPSALFIAIPQLFRAIELLLKARLKELNPSALA